MSDDQKLPALSLAQHFSREVSTLPLDDTMSPSEAVGTIRRALDRTASQFGRATDDPQQQRAGQWLIEIIKSGTGLIDRASHADIIWDEVARDPALKVTLRPTLFYGAAGLFALAGLLQGVSLVIWAAATLAGLRAVSSLDISALPFMGKDKARLTDESGTTRRATAVMRLDPAGLIAQVTDGLKTADHILMRLAVSEDKGHWSEETRLTALLQSLIEAGRAGDAEYALELTRKELPSLMEGSGLTLVNYSTAHADWFDKLPALGDGPDKQTAAPAIVTEDGRVLRRGTVWTRRS